MIDKIRTERTHLLFFSNHGFKNDCGGRFAVVENDRQKMDPCSGAVYCNINRCDLRGYVSVFRCLDNHNIVYHYQHKDSFNKPKWDELLSAWLWAEKHRQKEVGSNGESEG